MNLRLRDLAGRRVVVWGFGEEGRAAVRLLRARAATASLAVVVDASTTPFRMEDVPVLTGTDADAALARAEIVVKSPGVSPYAERFRTSTAHAEVTGGTALWFAETGGARTIAVTGSKGKSTTTSLVAHLLAALGEDVVLAGNVGRALLDVLDAELGDKPTPNRRYALELSSFQAAEARDSPEVGVLTALFPEHLDWHGSVERYYDDKCNLFGHRGDAAVAVNADNPDAALRLDSIRGARPYGISGEIHVRGTTIVGRDGDALIDLAGSALRGRHNAVNLAGALAAIEAAGFDIHARADELQAAVSTFLPLAHRLEPIGEVGGRLVIDDGLSTAPQAAVAALAAFDDRPVGIIVGGHDRGLDYTPLAAALAARRAPTWVLGVPDSGERVVPQIAIAVARAGNESVRVEAFDDFDLAVEAALRLVPEGGVILLSPAAPSFGRFTNYADRSAHFRRLVGLQ